MADPDSLADAFEALRPHLRAVAWRLGQRIGHFGRQKIFALAVAEPRNADRGGVSKHGDGESAACQKHKGGNFT